MTLTNWSKTLEYKLRSIATKPVNVSDFGISNQAVAGVFIDFLHRQCWTVMVDAQTGGLIIQSPLVNALGDFCFLANVLL